MESVSQVRELLIIASVIVGFVTALVTSAITLAGTYYLVRFKLGLHDDQIKDLQGKISNGNGLTQQILALREQKLDRERFEGVLFNSPGALQPQFAHLASRLTRVETICRERHNKEAQHAKESGA